MSKEGPLLPQTILSEKRVVTVLSDTEPSLSEILSIARKKNMDPDLTHIFTPRREGDERWAVILISEPEEVKREFARGGMVTGPGPIAMNQEQDHHKAFDWEDDTRG